MAEDKVKKFDRLLTRARRGRSPYTENYSPAWELSIDNMSRMYVNPNRDRRKN